MPQGRVDHSAKLPKFIADLRTSQRLSDAKIKVGKEVFQAHSLILGGQSPYFEKKFFTDGMKKVTLSSTTALVFRDVLGYFYTGQIEFQTRVKNYIPDLVQLTKLLGLQSLHEYLVDDTYAHMLSDEPVPEDVLKFYDQEAEVLICTEMFKVLPLNRVQELLSRDTFYVDEELDVFKAVMEWGKGRPEDERKAGLTNVRLALIPPVTLCTDVKTSGVFTDSEILAAIQAQVTYCNVRHRKHTEPESNVVTQDCGAEVLSGMNPEHLLDQADHEYSGTSGFTSHRLKVAHHQSNQSAPVIDESSTGII